MLHTIKNEEVRKQLEIELIINKTIKYRHQFLKNKQKQF